MNYERILNDFIEEVKEDSGFSDVEALRDILYEALVVIKKDHEASLEDVVEDLIQKDVEEIQTKKIFPGYTIGINVGNINVKYFGGDLDSFGTSMREDAMFDISSMSKMYTQIVLYNLIKDGYLKRSDTVKSLDSRFENLGDVTIGELMDFSLDFKTDENITLIENLDKAREALYGIKVREEDGEQVRGKYVYTDFGMMIAKEVMENVTGKSYSELFDKYISDKLGLLETKLIVPVDMRDRLTGSPNTSIGHVDDPKANALGGYSGHAGVFASSDDLIKFGRGIEDGTLIDKEGLEMAKSPTELPFPKRVVNRGQLGNTYIKTFNGLDSSYVEKFSPNDEFSIQGSTRTSMNIGSKGISTVLLNPASMSIDKALELQEEINKKRIADGKSPISAVRHFQYDENGVLVPYHLIAAQQLISAWAADSIIGMNAKTSLRLRLLNKFIECYDNNYDKEVKVTKNVGK